MSDSASVTEWIAQQGAINKLYAHDFKNPISAISANISYLEAVLNDVDEDVRSAIDDSAVAMRMLLHMVENFLQISRLEAGEQSPRAAVPLDRLLNDAVTRCRRLNPVNEPTVTLEGPVPDVSCEWPTVTINLALDNMILTALHHTSASGSVRLRAAVTSTEAIITCSDDGYPVAAEFVDKAFDREFQAQAKSLSNARYGRAMAMYAVGLCAKALGGGVVMISRDKRQDVVLTVPLISR